MRPSGGCDRGSNPRGGVVFELRADIQSVVLAAQRLEEMNAKLIEEYAFNDEYIATTQGLVRLRTLDKSGRSVPGARVECKATKTREEFPSIQAARAMLTRRYTNPIREIRFSRVGKRYSLPDCDVYLEDVEGCQMVEVEAADKDTAEHLLRQLDATPFSQSMYEIMRARRYDGHSPSK